MTTASTPLDAGDPKRQTRQRLILGLALIGVAVAALALFEHLRQPAPAQPAPHEPAQALIITPSLPEPSQPLPSAPPPVEEPVPGVPAAPPPPPVIVNEAEKPPAPATARAPQPLPVENAAYLVQAGVFTSSANAHALRQRLAKAGIRAKVETRVQLGPYQDRREAEQALAKLRKLGVNAVLVPAR